MRAATAVLAATWTGVLTFMASLAALDNLQVAHPLLRALLPAAGAAACLLVLAGPWPTTPPTPGPRPVASTAPAEGRSR